MRLTKLNFEQILEELNDPDHYFPKPLLHGEMRSILSEEGEDAKKAEAFFRELLGSDNSEDKRFALSCLRDLECMEEETWNKLKAFPEEANNRA